VNDSIPPIDVEVQIDVPAGGEPGSMATERLVRAVQAAAQEAGFAGPAEMSLVITDDARVQELNRTYRGVDQTTDVLAFGATEEEGDRARFVAPPAEGPLYLGDVIISFPQAKRQADERGHPVASELCLLTVHGTLHLLGYDHADAEEQRRMWALQRGALRRLGCEEASPEDAG